MVRSNPVHDIAVHLSHLIIPLLKSSADVSSLLVLLKSYSIIDSST